VSVLLLPLLPLVAAVGVWLLRGRPRVSAAVAVGALAGSVALGVWAAATEPATTLAWSPAFELALRVEGIGRLMVVLVPFVGAPILAYAAASESHGRARLLVLLLAFVAAMLLLVIAADFVTLLVAWELVGAVSWALIGHVWRERDNIDAATQAFLTTRLGDLGLYLAAGATFAATGSFGFAGLDGAGSPWLEIAAGGVLLAAAAKSAQVPFSPWLFAAMAGPTPVSALLHSATLVAAGAYLVIRLAPVLEPVGWFLPVTATLGLLTALAGGVVATLQGHVKRALAASTSAQYGLMLHAVGAGSTVAAAAQLVTHAAFKSLFFLAAGVAIHATGTALLGRLRVGRAYPFVALSAGAGALALAGLPPLGGAWSKEAILAASFDASTGLGVGALAAGLLTALYAARLQLLAFGPGGVHLRVRRPTRPEIAALAVLAGTTIALGVLWLPGVPALLETVVGGELVPARPWEFLAALGVVVTGGLGAAALDRRGRLEDLGLRPGTRDALADWLGLPWLTNALVVAPTIRLSRALARADDRVIDAGVRAAARVAELMSSLVSRRLEISIDGLVTATAAATMRSADVSRVADDAGVDAAIEAAGRGVGIAGHQSRRLQTGQSHEYFVIVAAGLVVIAGLLAITR